MLEIILIVVGVIIAALAVLAFLALKKPETLAPLMSLLMRNKFFKRKMEEQAIAQVAANPEQLQQLAGQSGISNSDLKQVTQVLNNFHESEREEKLAELLAAAQSGKPVDPSLLQRTKPRTADEARAKNRAKSKNRAKNKQARKARKKTRR